MTLTNRFVRFVKRPDGAPTPDVFEMGEAPVPDLNDGEFLVRNCYLSMDPALVGRMRAESNYADFVEVGEIMHGYGIGQVIESRHPKVKKGELRLGQFNMQEYAICRDAEDSTQINAGLAEPSWYLSVTGITGMTAYFALADICKPKAGETMVVSAGGSSVGVIAAQMAKHAGCRTVAIVSTDEKAERIKDQWGYDAAVSYRDKSVDQLQADLAAACPHGIDIYFDNTSGDISEALLDLYNDFARIAVIGRLGVAHLSDTRQDVGRRDNNVTLAKRLTKKGMVLLDYKPRSMEAIVQLARMIERGELKFSEDVMEGIDNVPAAFFRMLAGKNEGKQLVKLADVDDSIDPAPRKVGKLLRSSDMLTGLVAKLGARKKAA